MPLYWFILGALSVWRITHLLAAEDGPWQLIARLRRRAGQGFFGELMDCFYCLSLWTAAPVAAALAADIKEGVLLWLALSAAAILMERLTAKPEPPLAPYFEETPVEEKKHVVLRKEQGPLSE